MQPALMRRRFQQKKKEEEEKLIKFRERRGKMKYKNEPDCWWCLNKWNCKKYQKNPCCELCDNLKL